MASLKDVTLRIPEVWSPTWFRTFVVEYLAKADVRNSIGEGVTISSEGNSVATISSAGSIDAALAAHVADPLTHTAALDAHKAEFNPHTGYPLRGESECLAFFLGE